MQVLNTEFDPGFSGMSVKDAAKLAAMLQEAQAVAAASETDHATT